jgi:autotransporter-associated beta strand protein
VLTEEVALVIDNGTAGYSETGTWANDPTTTGAYGGTARVASSAGNGTNTATWQATGLAPGTYTVQASWVASGNNATDSPYAIYDGSSLLTTTLVDQTRAASGPSYGGVPFQTLASVTVNSGTLKVVLSNTNTNNTNIVADAIGVSFAATRTWTGAGATPNRSDPNNWGGAAPNPGDSLVFPAGVAATTSHNDFPAGTGFGTVTFSGAGYAVTGNDLGLIGGIDASAASGTNTFGPNVTLLANENVNAGGNGTDLALGGTVNLGGFTLTVGGGAGTVDFNAPLGGSGGLTVSNAGTTDLKGGGNTYTGATSVQGGTLVLETTAGVAGPGPLTVGAATVRLGAGNQVSGSAPVAVGAGGLLDLNNHSTGVGSLALTGAAVTTGTGALTLGGALTDNGASSVSGHLVLAPAGQTVTVNSGGTLTVGAAVSGGSSLTKAGPGTLVLAAANSYAGGTTLMAGTLAAGNNAALGTGTLTLTAGTFTASGSAVSLANPVTLAGSFSIGGSQAVTFTGPATLTGNRTVTVNNGGLATFAAAIGQSGGTWGLTKTGAGVLVLATANSYAGGTTLTRGTLAVGDSGALGSGTLTLGGRP